MKETIASIGSVASAFLASLCCIGPLIFALIGVGGIGFAARFEAYRPYFIGLTFLLLGGAFYVTYGRQACEPGAACEVRGAGKTNRIVLWIATAFALVFVAAPYLLSLL
ncbi:MAG: hypothetical protein A3F84_21840 [Candidatus Handelsmanbacteria bacterium RIFCSPLOWO2_12_FULL_64_10]|uniref:Mercuric transport protein MerT n=1 Tax=Handelsmanbacteria sp. (strain RIFCSPLOWO2_12_FULL_64_10) TaxID=1817868 RepID=A0A1F6D033_HANXR|nr:MAG: hypothetical protein A3F84_21840 [Candidatus Handelsmanbacteria bacterium RIFCSPLOWO2_12_FULL_64_10]